MARDEAPPWDMGQTYYNGGAIDTNNLGGVNLDGKKYTVQYQLTAGNFGKRVTGKVATDGGYGYPVDPRLPAAGVPVNDLFYIIVSGPTLCKTPLDGAGPNVFAIGDILTNLTGVTSGATTSGRVIKQQLSAATTAAADINASQFNNVVGRAMSAATTANTNSDLLVQIGR